MTNQQASVDTQNPIFPDGDTIHLTAEQKSAILQVARSMMQSLSRYPLLREELSERFPEDVSGIYVVLLGSFAHNIPTIIEEETIDLPRLLVDLDMIGGKDENWGYWAKVIADVFEVRLPDRSWFYATVGIPFLSEDITEHIIETRRLKIKQDEATQARYYASIAAAYLRKIPWYRRLWCAINPNCGQLHETTFYTNAFASKSH